MGQRSRVPGDRPWSEESDYRQLLRQGWLVRRFFCLPSLSIADLGASTNGAIHVSYAYVRRPRDSLQEPPEVFHTRQLSYPVLVTVYHMLECHAMDILSYSGATTTLPPYAKDDEDFSADAKARKALLHVGEIADWCIFSIEVRNTYGLPFEVTFERNQEGR